MNDQNTEQTEIDIESLAQNEKCSASKRNKLSLLCKELSNKKKKLETENFNLKTRVAEYQANRRVNGTLLLKEKALTRYKAKKITELKNTIRCKNVIIRSQQTKMKRLETLFLGIRNLMKQVRGKI
jgi:hypothetical protein